MKRTLTVGGISAITAVVLLCWILPSIPVSASAPRVVQRAAAWTTRLRDPGPIRFSDVSCPTSRVCTAVGDEGLSAIFRTVNGGTTWNQQVAPAGTPALTAVSCPTTQFCLASYYTDVASDPIDTWSQEYIETTDGGAQWVTRTTVPFGGAPACAGASRCYTFAGSYGLGPFARTTDGGAVWQTLSMRGWNSVDLISCVRRSDCFVVGRTGPSTNLELGKIVGFGARVIKVAALPRSAALDTSELSCPSTSSCVIVGNLTNTRTEVLTTSDGGTSWKVEELPSVRFDGPTELSCADTRYCVAVGNLLTGGSSPEPIVAATTENGGTSWSVSPVGSQGEIVPEGGLDCPSAGTCFMVGLDAVVQRPAGATGWSKKEISAGPGALSAVTCAPSSTCIALGSVVERSVDGGLTWTQSPNPYGLDGVSCPSATNCLATSNLPMSGRFVLYRSADAGVSWSPVAGTEDASQYSGIMCTSATTCIATTYSPSAPHVSFVQTTDGGITWRTYPAPTGLAGLAGLSCGSPTNCVAIGVTYGATPPFAATSTLYTSTTGGTTWTASASIDNDTDIGSVSCTSASTCWASGSSVVTCCLGPPSYGPTHIYETVDGGHTWTDVATVSTSDGSGALACLGMVCQLANNSGYSIFGTPTFFVDTSVDGGADWTAATLADQPTSIGQVAVTPSGGWVLVGGDSLDGALIATSP